MEAGHDSGQAGEAAMASPAPADLETIKSQRDSYLSQLQRVAADFENYKRRQGRDEQARQQAASKRLLSDLLDSFDDVLRLRAYTQDPELLRGLESIEQRLVTTLSKHGLSAVRADGIFDPAQHDVLMTRHDPDVPAGQILEVLRSGWRFDHQLLRPARVIVASDRPPEINADG